MLHAAPVTRQQRQVNRTVGAFRAFLPCDSFVLVHGARDRRECDGCAPQRASSLISFPRHSTRAYIRIRDPCFVCRLTPCGGGVQASPSFQHEDSECQQYSSRLVFFHFVFSATVESVQRHAVQGRDLSLNCAENARRSVHCCSAAAGAWTWKSTLDGWLVVDVTATTSRSKRSATPSRSGWTVRRGTGEGVPGMEGWIVFSFFSC